MTTNKSNQGDVQETVYFSYYKISFLWGKKTNMLSQCKSQPAQYTSWNDIVMSQQDSKNMAYK